MDEDNSKQDICFINASLGSHVYYYCAAAPEIVTRDNQPCVQYQVFRNNAQPDQYYAILSLQTQLLTSLTDAQYAAHHDTDIPADATLLPLPVMASTATLSIPGIMNANIHNTSLGNSQFCYMMVSLTQAQDIERLAALLKTPQAVPIAVSYKIDYLQQLPPSTFELNAQWQRVYDYLKTNVGFNALIFSVDIEHISETLLEQRLVTIQSTDIDPQSHVKEAGLELTQILMANFFTPVFGKVNTGAEPRFGFYLQQVSIEDIEQRTLSARIAQTSVVRRSFYPQALFTGLIGNSHYSAETVISYHTLADEFFACRTVNAQLLTPQLDANIKFVVLNLTYGTTTQSLVFSASKSGPQKFIAPSMIDPVTKRMVWPVEYSFTLNFNHPIGGVTNVTSAKMTTAMTELYLDVESLYSRYRFMIHAAKDFDWQWYSAIFVKIVCYQINHVDNHIAKSLLINRDNPSCEYELMLPEPEGYQFEVFKEYSVADNAAHIAAKIHEPTSQDITLFSRLYKQRQLLIVAGFNWEEIDQVIVTARYLASPSQTLKQDFSFSMGSPADALFSADQPDAEVTSVDLDILIVDKQGQVHPKNISTDADSIDIANLY
ncbi:MULTISPECIES: hypothetical protein [Dickeya]|uniref:Uncharacterized protein n=1 Tax=Dickeya aquatica TaxID=1401087 RepID=A0A375A968_9GAMM|nr:MULTISPECIES: hypothetical protein [Dickeya]SLM62580.1 hypothetical protein DAQ1742_01623 [Dickeya aquatica]